MADTIRADVTSAVEKGERTVVEKWKAQFAAYDKKFSEWEARVDRILKRYRDEQRDKSKDGGSAKFNVLWANVQTLVPAVYSRTPKPDVSRRFKDNDPVGRVASLIAERALEFDTEHYPDYRNTLRAVVYDRFLGGRGQLWARYEPHIRAVEQEQPTDGTQITEDVDEPNEELDYECAPTDYVPWRDFGHTVARTWDEVTAVWRKVYLTREACIERFGEEKGATIPLDCVPDELKKNDMGSDPAELSRACVYEIWDKLQLKAIWVCPSMPDVLDEKDDPLELEGFFPCPKPLYATMTSDSLIPVPDFALYQDQAKELDTLADRIQGLVDALQVKGVYDASIPALARLFTEGDNGTLIPIPNWQAFAEKNGLAGAIDIVDLKPIYEALRAAYEAVDRILQQIYNITGMSDIVRGQSDPNATATAERIKGQYASLRLKAMQTEVAVFASHALQLKAQIIFGNYSPETIMKMAAVQELKEADQALVPQAMALLIGEERMADPVNGKRGKNPLRAFRIDVNADTMVQMDEEEEKTKRVEFVAAIGEYLAKSSEIVQAAPAMAPAVAVLLKFVVTAFKVGKTVEGELDAVIEKAKELAANPPPKQDPAMAQVEAQKSSDQARLQFEQQSEMAKGQREQAALAAKQQAEQQNAQFEASLQEQKMQHEKELKERELTMKDAFDRWKVEFEAMAQERLVHMQGENTLKNTALAGEQKAESEFASGMGGEKPAKKKPLDTLLESQQKTHEESKQLQADTAAKLDERIDRLEAAILRPKRVVRGADGRVAGIETVQ